MSYQMFVSATCCETNTTVLAASSSIHEFTDASRLGFCSHSWFCLLLQVSTSLAASLLHGNPTYICKLTCQRKKEHKAGLHCRTSKQANSHTKVLNTFLLQRSHCNGVEKSIRPSVYHSVTAYRV